MSNPQRTEEEWDEHMAALEARALERMSPRLRQAVQNYLDSGGSFADLCDLIEEDTFERRRSAKADSEEHIIELVKNLAAE